MLHEIIKQATNPMFWFTLFCMTLFVVSILLLSSAGCILSGFNVFACGM